MIHPSYVDLMQVVNKGVEEGETPVINSRYSIVMATAKRARQIVDGDEVLIDSQEGDKPLSLAVEELNQEKIRILAEDEVEEDEAEADDLLTGEYADSEEFVDYADENDEAGEEEFADEPADDEIVE